MRAATETPPARLHIIQAVYSHGRDVDYSMPLDLNGSDLASLHSTSDSESGQALKASPEVTDIDTESDREYARQMREWRQELDEQLHIRSPPPIMISNLRRDSYSSSASTVPDGVAAFSQRKSLIAASSILLPQQSQALPPLGGLSLAPIITTAECFVPPLALPTAVLTSATENIGVLPVDPLSDRDVLEQQQQQQQQLNRKVSFKLELSKRFNKFKTFLERSLTSSATPTASSSSPLEERTPMAEFPQEYDYVEALADARDIGNDGSDDYSEDEEEHDLSSSELSTTSSLSTHAV
ncbi:hypothetical protein HDU82_003504, partial [Entophlyctis luteolus]